LIGAAYGEACRRSLASGKVSGITDASCRRERGHALPDFFSGIGAVVLVGLQDCLSAGHDGHKRENRY
jgi:hypothetical protein